MEFSCLRHLFLLSNLVEIDNWPQKLLANDAETDKKHPDKKLKSYYLLFCKIKVRYYLESASLSFLSTPSLFCQVFLTRCCEETESAMNISVSEHLK